MASLGYVKTLLNRLEPEQRATFAAIFDEVLQNIKLGTADKAANLSWYQISSTTPANANTEFSIAHGLAQAPNWLVPVLDLTSSGSQLVPLSVSRAADSQRVYLKSTSTSAAFTAYIEI